MKYILNTGRNAISFEIEKGGLKKTIVLDRRRLYNDTGNVATTGVTAIEDDDYEILKKLPIFKKRFADKSFGLSEIEEEQAMGKPDPQASKLAEENKNLKKELEQAKKAVEKSKDAKAVKALEDENASLKAQLEALKQADAGAEKADADDNKADADEEKADAGEEKADEDEGF